MAGQCLDKLPHSCGTRAGLQVFERDDGTVDGYCFSCKAYVRHPYGGQRDASTLPKPKLKTPEEILEEIKEITEYQTVDVPQKRLRKESLEYYGVKTALSEEDGKTPTMLCYPYTRNGELVGYKLKTLGTKRLWSVGDIRGADLFGWEAAISSSASRLIITEGEDDAVALHRAIQMHSSKEYLTYTAVVSLPRGAGTAAKVLLDKMKDIKKYFTEVMICFDSDEPGKVATEEVCKVLPTVKVMTIPCKDANQCVIEGKSKALYSAMFKASKPKNTRLVLVSDIMQEVLEPPRYGELSWPWAHINKATRGIRLGDVTYIGAGTKMGKSELVNALAAHFILVHNAQILLAKPEESNKKTVKLLAGKFAGKFFHDPEKEYDEKALLEAAEKFQDKTYLLNLYQHIGWETLKEDILEAVSMGVKAVFIDPITNLTSGVDPAAANVLLEKITEEISIIARDNNIHVFIFCHLRAHEGNIAPEKRAKAYSKEHYIGLGNCPHEFGGDVLSSQFAGSRAMQRKCQTMIALEGNRDPNLPVYVSNLRHLKILEEREFGAKGVYPIRWDQDTSLFVEA